MEEKKVVKKICGEDFELVHEWASKEELVAAMEELYGENFDFEYPYALPSGIIRQ